MLFYMIALTLISTVIGYEYFALTIHPTWSLLTRLQLMGVISPDVVINTTPGKFLSFWLGVIGFALLVLMNLYTIRKKFEFMHNLGRLSNWLNFHIFCGLLGPVMIMFHSGLKVRGIVGISFWSMVVSFTSGIVGRYFLVQLGGKKSDFERHANEALSRLDRAFQKLNLQVDAATKNVVLQRGLVHVGGRVDGGTMNPLSAFFVSMTGDLRLAIRGVSVPSKWPENASRLVAAYAVNQRKAQTIQPFQSLLGYWHAFHFPFAIFMYIAAVIHIVSSLIFLGKG